MFRAGEAGDKSKDCEVLLAVFFSFLLQAGHTFVPIVKSVGVVSMWKTRKQESLFSSLGRGNTISPSWIPNHILSGNEVVHHVRFGQIWKVSLVLCPNPPCNVEIPGDIAIWAWYQNKRGPFCPTRFYWLDTEKSREVQPLTVWKPVTNFSHPSGETDSGCSSFGGRGTVVQLLCLGQWCR